MAMAETIWTRLQQRWETLCPQLPRGGLNEPATEKQVLALERLIGADLPEDVRDAYLHFNGMQRVAFNGGDGVSVPRVFAGMYHWIDLQQMAIFWTQDRTVQATWERDEQEMNASVDETSNSPVLRRFYSTESLWIPIGCSDSSPRLAIDLAPTKYGHRGQLINLNFEYESPTVVAAGLKASVGLLLDQLDSGQLSWSGSSFQTADGRDVY
jgi:cell wall assembly regulator SMI1